VQVKTVVKTDDGFVKFEGELTQAEADYVMGIGLNILMQRGATFGEASVDEDATLQ